MIGDTDRARCIISTGLSTETQFIEQFNFVIVLNIVPSYVTSSIHIKMHIIDRQCMI